MGKESTKTTKRGFINAVKLFVTVTVILLAVSLTACGLGSNNVEINKNGDWVIDGKNTGVKARGEDGTDGITPTVEINSNGYWIINGENTGVKAHGENGNDGTAPTIEINQNGYWVINGVVTDKKALGENGSKGEDGITPTVEINNYGYWVINGENTGVKAKGESGDGSGGNPTIEISQDGYWLIDGISTGVKAQGENGSKGDKGDKGDDGITPTIEINQGGYWVINGITSDVKAVGKDGADGSASSIEISQDGYWIINGEKTDVIAQGKNGENGKGIFEIYKEIYGYDGTEEEWLDEILNKTLGITTYTVTFDYNGLEITEDMLFETSVKENKSITLPVVEREGYTFEGWFTGKEINDGQWLNTMAVTSDLNIVARWKKNSFTVRFESEDGEFLKEETVLYGGNATAPIAPHKDNYIFQNWNPNTTNITADEIIRPIYSPVRYTVTYNTDGGNEIEAETYLYNEIPSAPITPIKSGFVFVEWKISDSDISFTFDRPLSSDIELLAVWTDTIGISTVEELIAIGDNPSANYSLLNNINLKGANWTPLGEFKGTLDGQGYKIYNFTISTPTANMGFFTKNSGTIKNIVFSDVAINNSYSDNSDTAVVAAINNGTISNVTLRETTLTRTGSGSNKNYDITVGGVVGTNNGTISDIAVDVVSNFNLSYETHSTYGDFYTYNSSLAYGNIVGKNYGTVLNSIATADIIYNAQSKATTSSTNYTSALLNFFTNIGGIAGVNETGTINTAKVNIFGTATFTTYYSGNYASPYHAIRIAGIAGQNRGEISNAYTEGNINIPQKADAYKSGSFTGVGGIVGYNANGGNIDSCKSSINMDFPNFVRTDCGGIAGETQTNTNITNCIYDGKISGKTASFGGIVGWSFGGVISNCLFVGTVEALSNITNLGGFVGHLESAATIKYCINDGQITVPNSTTAPQYIADSVEGKTVIKCYRTENATLTVGEELTDGAQADIAKLKLKEEIFTEEFLYETLLFDEEVWSISDGEISLIALE